MLHKATVKKQRSKSRRLLPAGVETTTPPSNPTIRRWIDEPDVGCIPVSHPRGKRKIDQYRANLRAITNAPAGLSDEQLLARAIAECERMRAELVSQE